LISGLLGCALAFYIFLTNHYGFIPTTLGFPLLAASFTALTIAALSPSSWLHKLRIPGATTLAVWSYAIYLTHKPMTHIVYVIFSGTIIGHSGYILLFIVTLVSLATAFLLHTGIETPFLKLRDKLDVMIQRN
jgi:peptidoglycan/LPS O-acetylase OafA/YrhL